MELTNLTESQEIHIDSLEAGPELDILIAEKVMGWRLGEPHYVYEKDMHGGSTEQSWEGPGLPRKDGTKPLNFGFNPSTSISAAWEVVEKLYPQQGFALVWYGLRFWEATFALGAAEAATAPVAICRAAMKVVIGLNHGR